MSNSLPVRYSTMMNEDAKSAVESFAAHLRTVLEQYQNLWEHYVELNEKYNELKHLTANSSKEQHNGKDADSNAACKEAVDPIVEWLMGKSEPRASTVPQCGESDSINEHMLSVSMSDFESDTDWNISEQSKALAKELQTEMFIKSPVISKRHMRLKKTKNMLRGSNLNKLFKNPTSVSTDNCPNDIRLIEEEKTPEKKVPQKDIQASDMQFQKHSNQSKKLRFITSCNVNTSFLQGAKKLKQAKLQFSSPQKTTDVTLFEESDVKPVSSSTCHVTTSMQDENSPKTEFSKALKDSSSEQSVSDLSKPESQDIIESSPRAGSRHSRFRSQLMLKRKFPNYCQQPTKVPDNKKEYIYMPASNTQSVTRASTPLQVSSTYDNNSKSLSLVQKSSKVNDVFARNVSEGYGTMPSDGHEEKDEVSLSSIIVQLDDKHMDTQIDSPAQKRRIKSTVMPKSNFTKQSTNSFGIHEPTLLDETFFEPEEERLKNEKSSESSATDKKRNSSMEQMLPPSKKIQLDRCATSCRRREKSPKYVYKTSPVRNKVERAKLNGWSCWECKEYYGNLGLSEQELAVRRKQCSRHRAKFNEWPSTPQGFWDPVFPDTISSSYEDN